MNRGTFVSDVWCAGDSFGATRRLVSCRCSRSLCRFGSSSGCPATAHFPPCPVGLWRSLGLFFFHPCGSRTDPDKCQLWNNTSCFLFGRMALRCSDPTARNSLPGPNGNVTTGRSRECGTVSCERKRQVAADLMAQNKVHVAGAQSGIRRSCPCRRLHCSPTYKMLE